MRNFRFLPALFSLLLLPGCAGVGIVATSDPLTKLNDAEYLFTRENRPLPAERLIFEAMAIYKERDDPLGLGNANREYADLLRSPSIDGPEGKSYHENKFRDQSVTYENRIAKSSEYYSRAIEYYARAVKQLSEANRFDAVTTAYFNMANSYYMLGDHVNACTSYDKMLAAYQENIRLNPGAKPYSAPFKSIPDAVAAYKKQAHCS